MDEKVWVAWGICVNRECPAHYVGDMTWRRDMYGEEYAVCPVCDVEITSEDMPNTREDRERRMGF